MGKIYKKTNMFGKTAPSKRKTKILQVAMDNAPPTSKNLIVYQYNFKKRDYQMYNPFGYRMSRRFPTRKIRLVSCLIHRFVTILGVQRYQYER